MNCKYLAMFCIGSLPIDVAIPGKSLTMSDCSCALLLVICCVGWKAQRSLIWLDRGKQCTGTCVFVNVCMQAPALRSSQVHAEVWDYIRWYHTHACIRTQAQHNNVPISAQTVFVTCGRGQKHVTLELPVSFSAFCQENKTVWKLFDISVLRSVKYSVSTLTSTKRVGPLWYVMKGDNNYPSP